MNNTLCGRCIRLDLGVEKFMIEDETFAEASLSVRSLQLTNEQFELGMLSEIRNRSSSCRFCFLVSKSINQPMPEPEGARCYIVWETDGGESVNENRDRRVKRTRRIRLCWNHPCLKQFESYLVLAAPQRFDQSDLDYPCLLDETTQFLGRRIGSKAHKKNLIQEFLRMCERGHDSRCTGRLGIEDPFIETLKQSYFGVIDIINEKLVSLPYKVFNDDSLQFEPYAALSYVWGPVREYKTTTSNIQDRRKSGGLASVIRGLPKALQQSIKLVRDLGILYIWIDALCIVQNSSRSWNLNAHAMHLIYGNATLTVCAAEDPNATTGLLAMDDGHETKQYIRECAGIHLMLHKPPETTIEASQWNRRAWTFQERLLSKRCLIFTEGQVYFQCRSTCMSEAVFADRKGQGWSLDLVRAPLQMLSQLKCRALWFYSHCVSLYTMRDLYEPFDILAAFSGMCKLMEGTLHAPFTFGLPTSHLDFALLWEAKGPCTRRTTNSTEHKYNDMRFPSWSWCGWNGAGIQYKYDMVDSCLADVHGWLVNHTWIHWYIRDGYGTLRPLWNKVWAEKDESTDDRWKGYTAGKKVPVRNEADSRKSESENSDSEESYSEMSVDSAISTTREARKKTNKVYPKAIELLHRSNRSKGQDGEERNRKTSDRRAHFANGYYELSASDSDEDCYGRPLQKAAMYELGGKSQSDFKLTLPEDPYRVLTAKGGNRAGPDIEFPDQPILQFFTWLTSLHIVRSTDTIVPRNNVEEGLCRCHITDRRGDKCGSIVVNEQWILEKENEGKTKFEFIAISEAKSFTDNELPNWTYYIPKERLESEWDLYFVLLVEHSLEEGFYRRVALGKVFKAAFTCLDNEWKEIILG